MEITDEKAEEMYKEELSKGSINTNTTPHYNSFNQYKYMLIDMGYSIKEQKIDLGITKDSLYACLMELENTGCISESDVEIISSNIENWNGHNVMSLNENDNGY